MVKKRDGFTIVELVIVITLIAILSVISIVAYITVQVHSRDTARSSQISIIAAALEEYYQRNGEYPGCSAMTQNGITVSKSVLGGIDSSDLIAPHAPAGTTNSITCTPLTSGSSTDAYAYVGDGSTTCSTGSSCLQYTLEYRQESTGSIISVQSRHQTAIATSGTPSLSATTISNTQVSLSWNSINNASSYQVQWATNPSFTQNLTQASVSNTIYGVSSLTPGTTYYFEVAAVGSSGQGSWSNTPSATTTISAPSAPTMSAAISGSNAVGTSSAVTCPAGTPQYQLAYRSTATATQGSWSAWSAWSSTLTLSVAASQGYQYSFESQAECVGNNLTSATSPTSNIAATVDSISTPAAPTYLSPASFQSSVYAIVNYASYCPSGTNLTNDYFHSQAWNGVTGGPHLFGYNDSWQNVDGVNRTVQYWATYQCQTTYSTSPLSPSSYNTVTVYYGSS